MKTKEGDIFSLMAAEDKVSVGQILQKDRHNIYIVVFSAIFRSLEDAKKNLDNAIRSAPAIVARTSELFFKLERWHVIGNTIKADSVCFYPNYKIETPDGVFITNFDLQVIRKATIEEENFYFFYNHVSPAYVVSALKAYLGLIEMDKDYIKLTYEYVKIRSNRLN